MTYPLTIGNITLDGRFEGPNGEEEGLGDLGVTQRSVVREFPGGQVSGQLFGCFPKPLTWAGKLFGNGAMNRLEQLKKLAYNEEVVTFIWGIWTYLGIVADVEGKAKGPNEINYKIFFKSLDTTQVMGGNAPPNSDPFAGTVANAQSAATQQSTFPVSGGALPPTVAPGVAQLNQNINNALQKSGGVVSNLGDDVVKQLRDKIAKIQSDLDPIVKGSDILNASAASDLHGTLSILDSAFKKALKPLVSIVRSIAPNIYSLAARYLGSPLAYQDILDANGLDDPLPVFNEPREIIIPAQASVPVIHATTVMSDATAPIA